MIKRYNPQSIQHTTTITCYPTYLWACHYRMTDPPQCYNVGNVINGYTVETPPSLDINDWSMVILLGWIARTHVHTVLHEWHNNQHLSEAGIVSLQAVGLVVKAIDSSSLVATLQIMTADSPLTIWAFILSDLVTSFLHTLQQRYIGQHKHYITCCFWWVGALIYHAIRAVYIAGYTVV